MKMPKDKKAKAADKKQRVAAKTEKKVVQKEKKASKKPKDSQDQDTDDDADLDAVLASYAKEQERFLAVTETVTEPPSARASATFVGSPSNDKELLLFGGEYFNGALAKFYNDLFVYNINRDEWRLVTSPNSPLPRSGHAWTRAGNKSEVYLFGGEFSSPKQGTFYHYNDFWRLDPSTREWEKVEGERKDKGKSGGGPPARSGHRMTSFKQYIILFGGFQDTSSSTQYLSDLWLYDTNDYKWHQPTLPPASQRPDPRSSFSFLPRDDGAVLYGGYSRVKASTTVRKTVGRGGKGGGAIHEVLKPVVHTDAWFLRIVAPASDAPPQSSPTVRWEKRKRPVNAPNPPRAGATMAYHRGRGLQFGGVHDVENSEEGIESEFFNNLCAWNIDRNRCFDLSLRRPRTVKAKIIGREGGGRKDRGKRGEDDLLANLKKLEMDSDSGYISEEQNEPVGEDGDDAEKIEKLIAWEMPHRRFNAQLCVQSDVLYILGGTFEANDREYTFDEMLSIDLSSLAGVKEIFKRSLEDWQAEDSDSEDDEEEGDDGDEEDSGDEAVDEGDGDQRPKPVAVDELRSSSTTGRTSPEPSEADTSISDPEVLSSAMTDDLPHPRPFESLRDFFARTSNQWQELLLEELKFSGRGDGKSIKEVRKSAFERAETKWWDCREDITALEDEQDQAGIGEVVNLADKAASAPIGAGKRR